jgi:hypothetical protein
MIGFLHGLKTGELQPLQLKEIDAMLARFDPPRKTRCVPKKDTLGSPWGNEIMTACAAALINASIVPIGGILPENQPGFSLQSSSRSISSISPASLYTAFGNAPFDLYQ